MSNFRNSIIFYLFIYCRLDPYLSSEQDDGVIMFWMTITGRVVLFLPLAEVPQGEGSIRRDVWSLFFVIYYHKFYQR